MGQLTQQEMMGGGGGVCMCMCTCTVSKCVRSGSYTSDEPEVHVRGRMTSERGAVG